MPLDLLDPVFTLAEFPYGVLPYQHMPLDFSDSIRLVEIHAGRPSEVIICSINQYRLATAPAYEAISYTWGNPKDRRIIICGPDLQELSITANCESMICRLRRRTGIRRVWIDAICIEQTNVPERNSQVAMMGQIYQNASRVVVDIGGHESLDGVLARLFASNFKSKAPAASDFALDFLLSNPEEKLFGFDAGLAIKQAVNNLYERVWFERVWVLQEVYRAQKTDVICGTREVPWSIFRPIKIRHQPYMEQELYHPTLPEGTIPPVLNISNQQSIMYTARRDLFTLLRKARICDATDPRDKVFALLPMLVDAGEEGLSADYTKCPVQVFSEIAAWLLENFGLSVLSCIQGESKIPGLPSWVPDWSQRDRDEFAIGLGMGYPLKASGDTKPVADVVRTSHSTMCSYNHGGKHCFDVPRMLRVRGIAFDTIRSTSFIHDGTVENKGPKDFIAEVSRYRSENAPGLSKGRKPRRRAPKTDETRLHLPDWAARDYGLPFQWDDEESDNDITKKFSRIWSNRQLMLTKLGYFGLAPNGAKAGDKICVFLGGAVPFIIRKSQDFVRKDCVTFIGECYVYWMMEGEALTGTDLSATSQEHVSAPLEDFHII